MDNTTSPALPNEWINRLFLRFRSMYGNRVEAMWGTADQDDLRQAWGEELRRFNGEDLREALAAAMSTYRDYPPTLPQFVALCQEAKTRRAERAAKLPAPRTQMPDHVRAQLGAFVKRVTTH